MVGGESFDNHLFLRRYSALGLDVWDGYANSDDDVVSLAIDGDDAMLSVVDHGTGRFVRRQEPSGETDWNTIWATGPDWKAVAVDDAGTVVVVGGVNLGGTLAPIVQKYSVDGSELWTTVEDDLSGTFRSVNLTSTGDVVAVGNAADETQGMLIAAYAP